MRIYELQVKLAHLMPKAKLAYEVEWSGELVIKTSIVSEDDSDFSELEEALYELMPDFSLEVDDDGRLYFPTGLQVMGEQLVEFD
jgi:hypothetical protein